MKRLLWTVGLGVAGLMLLPTTASAQFGPRMMGMGMGGPGMSPWMMRGSPFGNPFAPTLRPLPPLGRLPTPPSMGSLTRIPNPVGFIPRIRIPVQGSGFVLDTRQIAVNNIAANYFASGSEAPWYMQSGSYMTGGSVRGNEIIQTAQREVAKAQREAALGDVRDQIGAQWRYETGAAPVAAPAVVPPPPDAAAVALRKALTGTDPVAVANGEALNAILAEIVKAEPKGTKGAPSAYIPPSLLADVRFAGSPAADLLTYARLAGGLPFPPAFDDPALAPPRDKFDKAFAEAATPVLAGREPTVGALTRLEVAFHELQTAAGAVLKNLPFEESADARRFLNRIGGAVRGLKGAAPAGLIDPKWGVEGLTVADLVRHMTRHKLQFGPAAPGTEESYATMHRNLATYLFVLTPPPKK
jgi:hypothetical protein